MDKKIYTLLLGLSVSLTYSQNIETAECGTDLLMQEHYAKFPQEKIKYETLELEITKYFNPETGKNGTNQIYEIPIVVHVISDGSPIGSANNRSDAAIQSWIDYTNKRLAADISTGMSPQSAKIPVKLVLAKIDPNCNLTNGINRIDASNLPKYSTNGVTISSDTTRVSQNQIRALIKWDPTRYYNIYMVNKLYAGNNVIGGVAQFPNGSKDDTFVTGTGSYIGSSTMSHEFGHALGLYHTFEGGTSTTCPQNSNCSSQGDRVCDTEPLRQISCPSTGAINPCTNLQYTESSIRNVMGSSCTRDYWTQGQANRALSQLLAYRQNLIDSPGLNASILTDNTSSLVQACTPTTIQNPTDKSIGITAVKFGSINNRSRPYDLNKNNFYENFTQNYCSGISKTNILLNTSTPLSISVGSNNHMVKAYIDYNNDGQFNENTECIFSQNISSNASATLSVTPPSNAITNIPLRMRVVGESATTTMITACYTPEYGQIEDYSVIIIPNGTLTTSENKKDQTHVTIYENSVLVKSKNKISSIVLYDASGRVLLNQFGINKTEFSYPLNYKNIIVTINIILDNGTVISKKLRN